MKTRMFIAVTLALSIALGFGCIDVNVILSPTGAGGGGSGGAVAGADGKAGAGVGPDAGFLGASCRGNNDCAGGNLCADGVCCSGPCEGACVACNLPGRSGNCSPVDQGVPDPHGVCKDEGAPSCGHNGTCDGVGGCQTYPQGTTCATPTCVDAVWTPTEICNGAGSCLPSTHVACPSNACDPQANSCSCNTGADCPLGLSCVNHGCRLALGQSCVTSGDCASTHCVDGVCCDSACSGGCQTCTARGTCVARSAGGGPRHAGDCPIDAPATCGLDGTCDGAGACRKYAGGTTCIGGTCNGNAVVGAYTCDGAGQCQPDVTVMVCAPYGCDPATGTCFTTCTTNSQCSEQACDFATGSCGKNANGAHCSGNDDCISGFCADGVCCDVACTGACVACNLPGHLGTCSPIPPGKPDPRGVCTDQGASTCGPNGTCDGAGGCDTYPQGTVCANEDVRRRDLHAAFDLRGDRPVRRPRFAGVHPLRLQRHPVLTVAIPSGHTWPAVHDERGYSPVRSTTIQ